MVIAIVVGSVLFALSAIHWYWVAGGKRGSIAAIPSNGSELLFQPSRLATGMVASALALAGWFVLELGGVFAQLLFPDWLLLFGGCALSIVFIARSIGEFRWLGFFKKRRDTVFAKWDSLLYSPLCLCIGIAVMMLVVHL